MEMLIGLGVFFLTLLLIYEGPFLVKMVYNPELRRAHQRLRALSASTTRNEAIDILKKKTLSEIPWLNRKLLTLSATARFERFLGQANTTHSLGFFLLLSAMLVLAGFIAAAVFRIHFLVMAVPSVLFGAVPFLAILSKRKKRIAKFERQLPEALELMARSLKAGHAFTGGLRLVAEEFGDPAGTEFGRTVEEINFGMDVPDALMNLTQRMPCEDLRFFAVSVIVQRETGGNLTEILESLGRLIRERFKFQGRVRVLSAEGRMSALVLVTMPFFVVALLSLLNRDYISVLFSDPLGTVIILAALAMMAFGAIVIKKLVSIRV